MKRLLSLFSLLIIASMALAACGGGQPAATQAPAATEAPAVTEAPASTQAPATGGTTLKIVSSLPMTGASLTQTQTIVNAEQLRLEQANNQACGGKYNLAYEAWDDASAALGKWDPAVETENGNKAAADKSVIAYLGTFNSGAAKLSIPILNQAGPLVMISPANTYSGLTKTIGAEEGEPDKYYPSSTRNYARVVTADDVQGAVDAKYMHDKLGVNTVYILDDQELYGKGVADVFEATAKEVGMTVVGHEGIDPKAADYKALMTKISTSNAGGPPDGIFVGMVVDNNASQLLKDKVSIMGDNETVKFMGPDGVQTQAFIDGAGADIAEGAYASVAGLAPDNWTEAGKKFLTDYEAKYGKLTEPYAIYGYEAMNVLLKAIEDVCASGGDPTDRAAVTKAVMAIKDFDGVLGKWSFDENGDTTLTSMTVYQVQGGAYKAVDTVE
ncbi:MAG TPA: branched-chain amino acid ABC transporter substrate-binding protein [Anaerolineales bacterium]|nr:branched-chain amino acid ABC transporter substrate-binding protein [Anaerolineales bacterium]